VGRTVDRYLLQPPRNLAGVKFGGLFADAGLRFDPAGVDVGASAPLLTPGEPEERPEQGVASVMAGLPLGRCSLDGMSIDCAWAMELRGGGSSLFGGAGSAYECPSGDCGPRVVTVAYGKQRYSALTDPFAAYGDGRVGFMAGGALLADGYSLSLTGPKALDAAAAFDIAMLTPGGRLRPRPGAQSLRPGWLCVA
jgi:hypothetical protein